MVKASSKSSAKSAGGSKGGRGPANPTTRTTARATGKAPRTATAGAKPAAASPSKSAKGVKKSVAGTAPAGTKATQGAKSASASGSAATPPRKPATAKATPVTGGRSKAKQDKQDKQAKQDKHAKKAAVPKSAKSGPAKPTAAKGTTAKAAAKPTRKAKGAPAVTRPKTDKAPRAARVKGAAPGRMRAPIAPIDTIRTPAKADDLKARLGRISGVIAQLRGLKRTIERSFYDIGELLQDVNETRLFEVKGYSSLEAFLDRETDLGSSAGMRALRAFGVFQREPAEAAGFARVSAALRALDGEPDTPSVGDRHTAASLPPHKLW